MSTSPARVRGFYMINIIYQRQPGYIWWRNSINTLWKYLGSIICTKKERGARLHVIRHWAWPWFPWGVVLFVCVHFAQRFEQATGHPDCRRWWWRRLYSGVESSSKLHRASQCHKLNKEKYRCFGFSDTDPRRRSWEAARFRNRYPIGIDAKLYLANYFGRW